MKYIVDLSSPEYERFVRFGYIALSIKTGIELKCKKCRFNLINDGIIEHDKLIENGFSFRKTDSFYKQECSTYFMEPLNWITDLHQNEGKINCPKCNFKLGCFNWSGVFILFLGAQCSCGQWITPAIGIHKSKVDSCIIQKHSQ